MLALTALALVFLAPLLPERAGDTESDERVTIAEREDGEAIAGSLGLTAVASLPFLLRRGPAFKGAQRLSAAVLVVVALLTITTVGLLYVPSAGLMVLAATRHPPRDPFR